MCAIVILGRVLEGLEIGERLKSSVLITDLIPSTMSPQGAEINNDVTVIVTYGLFCALLLPHYKNDGKNP